jgi:hypothetical protein
MHQYTRSWELTRARPPVVVAGGQVGSGNRERSSGPGLRLAFPSGKPCAASPAASRRCVLSTAGAMVNLNSSICSKSWARSSSRLISSHRTRSPISILALEYAFLYAAVPPRQRKKNRVACDTRHGSAGTARPKRRIDGASALNQEGGVGTPGGNDERLTSVASHANIESPFDEVATEMCRQRKLPPHSDPLACIGLNSPDAGLILQRYVERRAYRNFASLICVHLRSETEDRMKIAQIAPLGECSTKNVWWFRTDRFLFDGGARPKGPSGDTVRKRRLDYRGHFSRNKA